MTRLKMSTRKHNADTQYIYIKIFKHRTSALKMESQNNQMYLHVLGVNILQLPLGTFKLI